MSRVAYLGTSDFAAVVLGRVAASTHEVALVVTPPDRPKGRGKKMQPPPVASAAAEAGLPLLQAKSVNEPDAVQRLRGADADALVVCAFGQLIREPLLSEWPPLNVHPSLLPRWRGAAPIERAIMAGDTTTGVCIMRLTEGLDEGPVALREELPIGSDEDFGSLSARLAEAGGALLVRALDLLDTGELAFTEQEEAGATYAEKIDRSERRLDPGRPAAELRRAVLALTPHVGVYLQLPGEERLGVRQARIAERDLAAGRLEVDGEALYLGCGEGALELEVVLPPGGRPVAAADYLRGRRPPAEAL